MTDAAGPMRPSQLWKQLPPDRKSIAADTFWRDENAFGEQAEALAVIAQRIKSRLKSVVAMPVDKKVRQVVSLPAVSDALAARLLVSYHLAQQRPMMGSFLDALGIVHEDGLIADENLAAPAPDRLSAAVRSVAAAYPAADVSLYFSTLAWQDPDTWGGLSDLPETRMPAVTPNQAP